MADFAADRGEEGPRCASSGASRRRRPARRRTLNAAICSVAFDQTGAWLGVGDRGGHVRVYARRGPRYAPFCAFRSHEPELGF